MVTEDVTNEAVIYTNIMYTYLRTLIACNGSLATQKCLDYRAIAEVD